jgi:4-phytase / acid phosphatase
MLSKRCLGFALAALPACMAIGTVQGEGPAARGAELKYTVIVSRHGVRSPTWERGQLNQYSAEPWPDWGVPTAYLTPHGKKLMLLFGAYDRAYLARTGLLSAKGCEDAGRVYFWADTDQRTIETGRALAAGMLPDCAAQVHSLPEGTDDPLFSPSKAGVGRPDPALAAAAVSGRIGGNAKALLAVYRPAFETMEQVLLGCKPGANCPPEGKPVKRSLLASDARAKAKKGESPADLVGPLSTASTFAQIFLLEYTNGMTGKDLGWGRVTESNLLEMMSLHAAYSDLLRQTDYLARTNVSNLLSHVLKSMEQAVAGKAVPGALGKAGDKALIIVGHDTNISNIAGVLRLSWLIEGYQRDDTPPGGVLAFELWRYAASGEYSVRVHYVCQTLEQMRRALPLTLQSPPAKASVFVPGCSTADEGLPCGWNRFQRITEAAIDPAFVKP